MNRRKLEILGFFDIVYRETTKIDLELDLLSYRFYDGRQLRLRKINNFYLQRFSKDIFIDFSSLKNSDPDQVSFF